MPTWSLNRWSDRFIHLREWLLDQIAGVRSNEVLNHYPVHDDGDSDGKLAALLKQSLDDITQSNVSDHGRQVDYSGLSEGEVISRYRRLVSQLSVFNPGSLASREEKLAFWINLYNTLIIDGVISMGVRRSVVEGWSGALKFFRQGAYNIGGQRISLDDIEHGVLRSNRGHPLIPGPQFAQSDPRHDWVIRPMDVRMHFALNCASRSCPSIRAYSPECIENQLVLSARHFVRSTTNIDKERNTIHLSSLFRWFQSDFGGREGVIAFLIAHLQDGEQVDWISARKDAVRLRYAPYDWRLNTASIVL